MVRDLSPFSTSHIGYLETYTTVKLSDLTKNVSKFVTAAKHTSEVSNRYYLLYGVSSIFLSWLLDRMIDTDVNVSNTQTAATVALSSSIAQAVSQVLASHPSALSPIKDLDIASVCYDNIETMKSAMDRLKYISKLPDFAREKTLKDVGISEGEYLKLMSSMQAVFEESNARYSFILMVLAIVATSNAVHGYKRNDKSSVGARIGYSVLWALSGTSGLGLSLSQGYCKPLSKVATLDK